MKEKKEETRCKICDEKIMEWEQSIIIHEKCRVSRKDYEELEKSYESLDLDNDNLIERNNAIDYKLNRIESWLEALSKKPTKKDLEETIKGIKEELVK